MDFSIIKEFEQEVANFFGSPYAVAVDSCTHGVELSLRYTGATSISVPKNTYLSIPMLADKLKIDRVWRYEEWVNWYYLTDTVIDAAVCWEQGAYVLGSLMSVSFQYRKHLSLGRGGIILTDNIEAAKSLKKMSYDGRLPDMPWAMQNIDTIGYHYYMTPETAHLGLEKLEEAKKSEPKRWTIADWPDLTLMDVFKI
jgi:dTDP-4-amino-4,6-dideoxygalactose transaminase